MKKMLPEFVWTSAARAASGTVDKACAERKVTLLLGPSGCGKTALLDKLCQATGTPRLLAYRAEVPSTPRSLAASLLVGCGLRPGRTAIEDCRLLAIVLPVVGVEAVVVDDVQRLSAPAYDLLRSLHETAGVALVLCGTPRAEALLSARCPELAARVAVRHELGALRANDVFHLLRASSDGLRDARRLWSCVDTSRALHAASGGNFRRLLSVLEAARALARRQHRAVCARFVRQADEQRAA